MCFIFTQWVSKQQYIKITGYIIYNEHRLFLKVHCGFRIWEAALNTTVALCLRSLWERTHNQGCELSVETSTERMQNPVLLRIIVNTMNNIYSEGLVCVFFFTLGLCAHSSSLPAKDLFPSSCKTSWKELNITKLSLHDTFLPLWVCIQLTPSCLRSYPRSHA